MYITFTIIILHILQLYIIIYGYIYEQFILIISSLLIKK